MIRLAAAALALMLITTPARGQDAAGDLFVEASVDNPAPFIGQQIAYSVRVYDAVGISEVSPLYEPPEFEGFWRVDVQPMPYSQAAQQINNRTYILSEIRTALYPTRAGETTITPASAILPETVFRPAQRVESNAITVQVQPLPEGAPAGFGGAVGQFTLEATLDRQSVTLGEPVTLRLTVRGTGNVEQLLPPEVAVPDGWQRFSNPNASTLTQQNGRIVGEKVFEWVLVASEAGTHVLPAIALSYFDPSALAYRTLNTAPTTLEVMPGTSGQSPETITRQPDGAPPAIKAVPAVVVNETAHPGWPFWALWLAAPAAAAMTGGWVARRRRRGLNRSAVRRSQALARAEARIRAAMSAATRQACRVYGETLADYIGDKTNAAPGRLSQDDLRRVMAERKVTPEISRRVIQCLERANEAQYAPDVPVDAHQMGLYILDTLKLLDSAWEAR